MNELQLKLCDIQGRLFELSAEKKYNIQLFGKYSFLAYGFFEGVYRGKYDIISLKEGSNFAVLGAF